MLGEIEGEHTHIARAQDIGDIQGMAKDVQMRSKVVPDLNLADGAADGSADKTGVIELFFYLLRLLKGDVGHVLSVHVADLQPVQMVALHGGNLTRDHRAGFIGEGVDMGCMIHKRNPPFRSRWGGIG